MTLVRAKQRMLSLAQTMLFRHCPICFESEFRLAFKNMYDFTGISQEFGLGVIYLTEHSYPRCWSRQGLYCEFVRQILLHITALESLQVLDSHEHHEHVFDTLVPSRTSAKRPSGCPSPSPMTMCLDLRIHKRRKVLSDGDFSPR